MPSCAASALPFNPGVARTAIMILICGSVRPIAS